MSGFDEAQKQIEILADAPALTKFKAVCQWILGDPDWADTILEWMEASGYYVTDKPVFEDTRFYELQCMHGHPACFNCCADALAAEEEKHSAGRPK